jgi:hypothetical protein
LIASNDQRSPDKIRHFGHHRYGLRSGRWFLLHILRAIEFIPRIQKLQVIARPDQRVKFGFAEAVIIEVAALQIRAMFEQETSRFAAGRSSWFL